MSEPRCESIGLLFMASAPPIITIALDNKGYPRHFYFQQLSVLSFISIRCFIFSFFWGAKSLQPFLYRSLTYLPAKLVPTISRFCQSCFGQFLCQRFGQIMVFNTEIIDNPANNPANLSISKPPIGFTQKSKISNYVMAQLPI